MTLTDKQKQAIEKEAENLYPYVWPKNKEGEDFTPRPGQGAPFSNKVKKLQAAYIAGATAHALACIQKDEEIARLTALLKLKDEYIELLGLEINDLIGLASVHGWQSRNVELGEQLRAKIKAATEALKQ